MRYLREIPCPAFFMRYNTISRKYPRFLNIALTEARESSLGIRNPGHESNCLIQTLPPPAQETLGKIVELLMAVPPS